MGEKTKNVQKMELKDFFNFVPQFPVTGFDLQSFLMLPIPTIFIWNFGQDVFITGALPKNQQVPNAMISSLWLFLHYYFLQDKNLFIYVPVICGLWHYFQPKSDEDYVARQLASMYYRGYLEHIASDICDQRFDDFERKNPWEKKFSVRAIHILLTRSCTFPKVPIVETKEHWNEEWAKKFETKTKKIKYVANLDTEVDMNVFPDPCNQLPNRIEQIKDCKFREVPIQDYGSKRRPPIKPNVFRVYKGFDHETVLYDFPMCLRSALGKLDDPFLQKILTYKFKKALQDILQRKHKSAVPFIKFVYINDDNRSSDPQVYAKKLYQEVTTKSFFSRIFMDKQTVSLQEVVTKDKKS